MNQHGRAFESGKALTNEQRSLIIQKLIEKGAEFPIIKLPMGLRGAVSQEVKVSKTSVHKVWNRYCVTGEAKGKTWRRGRPRGSNPYRTFSFMSDRPPVYAVPVGEMPQGQKETVERGNSPIVADDVKDL